MDDIKVDFDYIDKPIYPVLLVAGESIEILGLKLLIKSEIGKTNECLGCLLNGTTAFVLCKQLDCRTNKVIISNEVVEQFNYLLL